MRLAYLVATVIGPALHGIAQAQCEIERFTGAPASLFGRIVDLDDDVAIVGAPLDVGSGGTSGAAFLYRFDGEAWRPEQTLTPPVPADGSRFGHWVAVWGDLAVVGARFDDAAGRDAGAAHVYRYSGGQWVPEVMLTASDAEAGDRFGESVAVWGDTVVVGAFGAGPAQAGAAYVYRYVSAGAGWVEEQILTASDGGSGDHFGRSVAVEGRLVVVGATQDDGIGTGRAYVFAGEPSGLPIWTEERRLVDVLTAPLDPGELFGTSVAIAGDVVAVGAVFGPASTAVGGAYVFRHSGSDWMHEALLRPAAAVAGDQVGEAVSLDGDVLAIGTHDGGSAYAYRYDGSAWELQERLVGSQVLPGDPFGHGIAVSGDVVFAGSPEESACYVFRLGGPTDLVDVSPPQGPPAGGNQVLVHGAGFTRSSRVLFGDLEADSVELVDSTTLRVEVPGVPPLPIDESVSRISPFAVDVTVFCGPCSMTSIGGYSYRSAGVGIQSR